MAYFVAAQIDEIGPGQRKLVKVNGRDIVVFNVDGSFYALNNRCPHQGASLCDGLLTVAVTSREPGSYDFDAARQVIRCPWHAWEFDIRTGRSFCEPNRFRVRSFKTEVESGAKLLDGRLAVESYPVRTDDTYILIDV
ncbi:MAG: Rieske (2Fe-2S) protein [Parvibaculaceae bacterium]